MTSIPDDIDVQAPFAYINVKSIANYQVDIICIDDNFEITYSFDDFQGLENRSEFFDRKPEVDYNLKPLSFTGTYSPVTYVNYEDFKDGLSAYEIVNSYENMKLWRFQSITNFVELYAGDYLKREIRARTDLMK